MTEVKVCELAERDGGGQCVCRSPTPPGSSDGTATTWPTLAVLADVRRLYEEKMARLDGLGGTAKLKTQVEVLRCWVNDLVGQNKLLIRAVEELEAEATSKLLLERKKHSEVVSELRAELSALERRLARKDADIRGLVEVLRRLRELDFCTIDGIHFYEKGSKSLSAKVKELKMLNESLQKDNVTKDREIKQLNKSIKQYEQTINDMKKEVTSCPNQSQSSSEVSKKDAEVMAGMCCIGAECSEWEPSKDMSELLHKETLKYKERIEKMEADLKGSSNNLRALRKVNVWLMEEALAMSRMCAALQEKLRSTDQRSQFKDDIINEMRKQLKHAKAKVQEVCADDSCRQSKDMVSGDAADTVYDSVTIVRTQPRRKRDLPMRDLRDSARSLRDQRLLAREQRDQRDLRLLARDQRHQRDQAEHCKSKSEESSSSDVRVRRVRTASPDVSAIQRSDSPSLFMSEASVETSPDQTRRSCPSKLEGGSSGELSPSTTFFWKRGHRSKSKKSNGKVQKEPSKTKSKEKITTKKVKTSTPRKVKISVDKSTQVKNKSKVVVSDLKNDDCPCDSQKPHNTTKDSGGVSSMAESNTSCPCDYSNKLLSTLQILQNQEETVRVQAESLAVADSRIKALNERVLELRQEADRKTKELQYLRNKLDSYNVQKTDVSISADIQMGDHKDIVTSLQNNLSVIEELYRECFYETAKQENLIDMLRNSYLDVRIMDRRKADQIGRLNTVIETQKLSLERCQDIALEVDTLKTEISNFLNSSTSSPNNDSGMWERSSEVPDVQEDLQEMMDKLLQLRDLLDSGCTCGLEEENKKLKEDKKNLTMQISELNKRLCCLECELAQVDSNHQKCQDTIQKKERETMCLGEKIELLKKESLERSNVCETLSAQLQLVQESLDSKNVEVEGLRRQCEDQEDTIMQLRDELLKMEQIRQDSCKLRSEVTLMTSELSSCRAQLEKSQQRARELHDQLQRTGEQHRHIEGCYREKASNVASLQAQLEEAQTRGAALCGEARRAVRTVRDWATRMRTYHRENEQTLKENEILIRALQQRLRDQDMSESTSSTSCGGCGCGGRGARHGGRDASTSAPPPLPPKRAPKKCVCAERRQQNPSNTGQQHAAHATPQPTWPTMLRDCPVLHAACSPLHAACTPRHVPHAARSPPHARATHVQHPQRLQRDISPIGDLASRMDQLLEAFEDGQRRWWRPRDQQR